jgi:hypothetical protein
MKVRGLAQGIVPLDDVDRPFPAGLDDQDRGASRQGGIRPGEEVLRTTAHPDAHLAGASRPARRDGDDAYRADA